MTYLLVFPQLECHSGLVEVETGPSLQTFINGVRIEARGITKHYKPATSIHLISLNIFIIPVRNIFGSSKHYSDLLSMFSGESLPWREVSQFLVNDSSICSSVSTTTWKLIARILHLE